MDAVKVQKKNKLYKSKYFMFSSLQPSIWDCSLYISVETGRYSHAPSNV